MCFDMIIMMDEYANVSKVFLHIGQYHLVAHWMTEFDISQSHDVISYVAPRSLCLDDYEEEIVKVVVIVVVVAATISNTFLLISENMLWHSCEK